MIFLCLQPLYVILALQKGPAQAVKTNVVLSIQWAQYITTVHPKVDNEYTDKSIFEDLWKVEKANTTKRYLCA